MRLELRLSVLLLVAVAWSAPAAAFDPAVVVAARRDLQKAVNGADAKAMLGVRARLAALAAAEPTAAPLQLWIATATWRAVPLLTPRDPKQAERLGDDALERMEKLLVADPRNADALALKGGLQGLLISLKPNSMMTLGPQSNANLGRAATIAPENPRVQLLTGVGVMHTPVNFGGGPEPALDHFKLAQQLFAKEAPGESTALDWGRDDAFLWAGRAQMALKDTTAARASFHAALEANPDNGWVRNRLLPEAEGTKVAKEKP